MTDHFEDLLQTIERNAVNNVSTITNVTLWVDSWRKEREMDRRHEAEKILFVNKQQDHGKENN